MVAELVVAEVALVEMVVEMHIARRLDLATMVASTEDHHHKSHSRPQLDPFVHPGQCVWH